jgi:uncharacterized protein
MKHLFIFLMILLTSVTFAQDKKPLRILVFSKTMGFRHESISSGIKMLYDQSKKENWVLTATEEAGAFADDILPAFDVAVFLNPTGDALNESQQAAFERFIKSGKGFVGIHSSADFEYDWPWYGQLNGGHFKIHPPSQEGTIIIENADHPAMKPFKGMKSYTTYDEWYTFKANPRGKVNVLATLDESSIKKADNKEWVMGDHPIIWWQEINGARAFYTGFGHTHEAFQNPVIIEHLVAAINWAGKR